MKNMEPAIQKKPENGDKLNHQAYEDIFGNNPPSILENEYYMQCYRFWNNIVGNARNDI